MKKALPPAVIDHCARLIDTLARRQQKGHAVVGIFDSGVGGLTVLPTLTTPQQYFDLYYRGDTAQFPYGEKTATQLVPLVVADIEYLVDSGCSLIGIACNTASIIWQEIVSQLPINTQTQARRVILDTISTTVAALANIRPHHTIGIIGTTFTVKSGAYERAIRGQLPDANPIILQSAQQALVTAIEQGQQAAIDHELARIIDYFSPYQLDVFILGCTHYGYIANLLANILPAAVQLINPSILLGEALRARLATFANKSSSRDKAQTIIKFTGETPAQCVY